MVPVKRFVLHHADSREHIGQIADHSVQLVLTGPPYDLNPYSTGNINLDSCELRLCLE
jgi:hypothetical protein